MILVEVIASRYLNFLLFRTLASTNKKLNYVNQQSRSVLCLLIIDLPGRERSLKSFSSWSTNFTDT